MNITLIFGNFGFPALGVAGAGISTIIARLVECVILIFLVYFLKTPVAASPRQMIGSSLAFTRVYLKTSLPVALHETLWALGLTTYNMIFARISTQFLAAFNIALTIENLAFVFLLGMVDASAILIGNQIGASEEEKAFTYARRSIIINVALGLILGLMIYLGSGVILSLYKISPDAQGYARIIITIMACFLWVKASNIMVFVGALRSGGDTRFALLLDVGTLWFAGIPLVLTAAFLLHLPPLWVYPLILSDELLKFLIGLYRFLSKRWINNLTLIASGL